MIIKKLLLLFGCILLLYVLSLSGCDNIKKCHPQINIKTGYVGIKCTEDW